MAGVLGLKRAFEPIEPDIVQRLQRNPDTLILTRELIKRIFLVGMLLLIGSLCFFKWELATGETVTDPVTAAVMAAMDMAPVIEQEPAMVRLLVIALMPEAS